MGNLTRKSPPTHHPRAPSFAGLRPASEASSRAMRRNRARDTGPELLLRSALRLYSLRYRLNDATLPGRPDLVFSSQRLVVFCDGDFWHGRRWARLRAQLMRRANAEYWIAKISANRHRDMLQRRALREAGWTVIRAWESEIRRNPQAVARRVAAALETAETTGPARSEGIQRAGSLVQSERTIQLGMGRRHTTPSTGHPSRDRTAPKIPRE
jgi:DNA mismatch endonuclease, patch repair protein